MSRVTSKLQVTLPKAVADRYGIVPGSDVTFEPAGSVILLRPAAARASSLTAEEKLELLDAGSARALARVAGAPNAQDRGWSREELYDRPVAR